MFTGIIQCVGKIAAVHSKGQDLRLKIEAADLDMANVSLGDSIATSGVCLTVIEKGKNYFMADVSKESLLRTTLGKLRVGTQVNLETALTLGTPLGGHLVSGHVDGVGEVVNRWDEGRSVRFQIKAPDALAKYISEKGSVCVDGISLTVNAVDGAVFDLNIVPHTMQMTTMKDFVVGSQVNLEVDLIARYLERLLLGDRAAQPGKKGIDEAFLAAHGFIK
ncbi:MAG: riboflavin synthase [Gammaproteobacteria bacterium]|nr:riboflavin synthase [Gammaproteobacteria bacterium]